MRLLIVEDDADLRRALRRALREAGFAVDESANGDDGLFQALEVSYDAIVLDLMLPGRDGWSVLEAIRGAGRKTPVLILTARDAVDDRVRGLDGGADDYLTKPFALDELIARVRALIRRAAGEPGGRIELGDLTVDVTAQRVFRRDVEVMLTAREFGILELLVNRRGTVVTRTAIGEHLYDDTSELMSNAIDVHVASLRRKLGPDFIHTRRGLGYLIDV
jgi:two-component system OmpR family response regulator